jgi:hypothetical protein
MAAESIMHILVEYNITAQATETNGRLVDFPAPRIAVEGDLGRGTQLSRTNITGKPLLTELQEIAEVGGIDFDLVQTAPRAWTFRVFAGQRGVDRTATVVFSRSRRNMGQIATNTEMQDPRTVIVVGGDGEGTEREFAVRYGPDYSTENHREYFEPFSSESVVMLQAHGDQIAQEHRSKPTLSFVPLQVSGTRYGIDYNLGDLVTGVYRDIHAVYQVIGVTLSAEAGTPESIVVELEQR